MAQGCTTLQAGLILSAALTANRQPSRRPVFNSICLICFEYRDSSLTLRMTMRAGRHFRNADFILIARRAIPPPSAAKVRCRPLLHNPPPIGGHNPRGRRPRPPSPLNPLNPFLLIHNSHSIQPINTKVFDTKSPLHAFPCTFTEPILCNQYI